MTLTAPTPTTNAKVLSTPRLLAMRAGYLLMVVGLAIVKWPLLPSAHSLPLYEGVTLSLLTAMSLLAILGLWHPVRLLPLLVFESVWKIIWLGVVALPLALTSGLDAATTDVAINCSLVVVFLAVTPWPYAWRALVRGSQDHG